MPARGWHHDLHVQHHPRDIRSNGGPAPMLIAKAQEMVRILGEVSDALESSASGLRYLAHGGTSAPTATPAENDNSDERDSPSASAQVPAGSREHTDDPGSEHHQVRKELQGRGMGSEIGRARAHRQPAVNVGARHRTGAPGETPGSNRRTSFWTNLTP